MDIDNRRDRLVEESRSQPATSEDSTSGQQPFLATAPAITLAKGGGAIRGISEKFAANPVTGTGSLTVPIAVSPGRSGFGPQLSLSYDSGAGNGPFGFGWGLSLPAITRKTARGLPRYHDAAESDVFVLSGAEDLVPELQPDGSRHEDTQSVPGQLIQRYRPRTEGLFARIERWTDRATGSARWRSISRDNLTTWYGNTAESRIADPADPTRIFSWLICESYDDKGNAMVYRYVAENDENVDRTAANERNRQRSANRHLKRILYGNRLSRLIQPDLAAAQWLFEVVFDYGEHDRDAPTPADDELRDAQGRRLNPWPRRPDPFSTYRAGFEIRTYRRCRRILMFHRFAELGAAPCLVRSTSLDYADLDYAQPVTVDQELAHAGSTRLASFIQRITSSGHVRREDGTYLSRSLPPLEFRYSKPVIQDRIRTLDAASAANLPQGLDGARHQWVDLEGEGVSGILTEQADAWFYKANEGEGRFGPMRQVAAVPTLTGGAGGRSQWLDLAGDGELDLVALDGPTPGFFERTPDATWANFRTFPSLPTLHWGDPNLRFVDLDGDGHADVLITEHQVFTWHPSLAEDGFGPARQVAQAADEEAGPRLIFADGTQSIHLADMCGDGLAALVRIRNGEVCYWPSLGYGRFGRKVTMDNAPRLERPDHFDQRRVRLADIDGSGTADIIYLDDAGARLYFNHCGNGWSDGRRLREFPVTDDLAAVMTADLLGNGTACLVWSSPLPGAASALQFIDLMGGQKPHLLVASANNLGAETRIHYRASTHFYLSDKAAGRPWITKLPFPVHVVERVEIHDHTSRNHFATRYAYHHGFFDGHEREFRGFGLVEQWDTETLAALTAAGELPAGDNVDAVSYVPPMYTKTWYHTGAYLGRGRISNFYAGLNGPGEDGEYYREPGLGVVEAAALLLEDTVLPPALTLDEEREACRALRGSVLRRELYARDDTARAEHSYQVTEQNFTIRVLQRRGRNRHGVFFVHAREALNYHYERALVPVVNGRMVDAAAAVANLNTVWRADPRTMHRLTLEADDFGNILKEATIAYGRRHSDPALPSDADREAQSRLYTTYTENRVTIAVTDADVYRTPLPCEHSEYEVTGLALAAGRQRFEFAEILAAGADAAGLAFEATPTPGLMQKRLLRRQRTLFRRNDLTSPLALGALESLALPYESYQLAFTPGLLAQEFQRQGQPLMPDPAAVLGGPGADRGGYLASQTLKASGAFPPLDSDDHWWRPSGRVFFSPGTGDTAPQELTYARQHCFLPHRIRDPFHTIADPAESFVTYDAYDLLPLETRDALGNRVTVGERNAAGNIVAPGNDYRVLQPALIMDANRNRTRVAFDALGLVVGSAVMGKPPPAAAGGDSLDGFVADLPDNDILNHLANPLADPLAILGRATTRVVYDVFAYHRTRNQPEPQPATAYALARETHDSEPAPIGGVRIRHTFSYSDGFGREIQHKLQATPGQVPLRDAGGRIVVDGNGRPQMTEQAAPVRWVGTGWAVFNNKGQPVRQFEPFFTDTHRFEFDVRIGVSPVVFYDPVGRAIATLHPDHTWNKTIFTPWKQAAWDVGDTVLAPDPRDDPDAGSFFLRLPQAQFLPTWFERRQAGLLGALEQDAARKAAIHAATPAVTHADSLGRPFLAVEHNRFKYSDVPAADPPVDVFHASRVVFDVTGNQREVRDARDRIVMRYSYDLLGGRVRQASMEAGERWLLNDVSGKPIRAWDSRGHQFRTAYDRLRRARGLFVTGADPAQPNYELLMERLVYGEQHPESEERNLRGALYLHLDQAGVLAEEQRDFKGNLRRSSRRLAREYRQAIDWSAADAALPAAAVAMLDLVALAAVLDPHLEAEVFASETSFDALNRPLELVSPHAAGSPASVVRPHYNEASLLERLDANLRRETDGSNGQHIWAAFVTNIDYDAQGRRTRIQYGNGAETRYRYDPETLRLTHLYSRRGSAFTDDCDHVPPPPLRVAAPPDPPEGILCGLQNLHYVYDPSGNITHLRDNAQRILFFRNRRVEPSADYTYDALHRLIEATGREHLGQAGVAPTPHSHDDAPRVGLWNEGAGNAFQPGDGNAMGNYLERYIYDTVGNMEEMHHHRLGLPAADWTRTFEYNDSSQLDPLAFSNRLSRTLTGSAAGGERFRHDIHGNMIRMPHLGGADPAPNLFWDYRDQLCRANLGSGTAYCVYDARGQRMRKVWEKAPGLTEERIYLGGFEIFRRRNGGGAVTFERETLHIADDRRCIALVETRTLGIDETPVRLFRYQLANQLGSTNLELDDQARILSYSEYAPYGSTVYQAVRNQIQTPQRLQYSGKERDEETGLYFYGARYYAPWLGRWTACDQSAGANRYSFVDGRPSVAFDVGGLKSNRQLLGLDDASVDAALAQDPSVTNILKLTAKQTLYDVWNGVTAGFVSKHDALFEARQSGNLSETDYWTKTTGEASKSLLVATVSASVGGAGSAGAKTLLGAVATGAARGAVSGAVSSSAADLTGQLADVALGNQSGLDLEQTVESAQAGAITGGLFGAAASGIQHKLSSVPKGESSRLSELGENERELVVAPTQKTRQSTPAEEARFRQAKSSGREYVAVTENPAQAPKVTWGNQTGVDLPDDLSKATKIEHPHPVSEVAALSTKDVNEFLQRSDIQGKTVLAVQGTYGPTRDALAQAGVDLNLAGVADDAVVTTFVAQRDLLVAHARNLLKTFLLR